MGAWQSLSRLCDRRIQISADISVNLDYNACDSRGPEGDIKCGQPVTSYRNGLPSISWIFATNVESVELSAMSNMVEPITWALTTLSK